MTLYKFQRAANAFFLVENNHVLRLRFKYSATPAGVALVEIFFCGPPIFSEGIGAFFSLELVSTARGGETEGGRPLLTKARV